MTSEDSIGTVVCVSSAVHNNIGTPLPSRGQLQNNNMTGSKLQWFLFCSSEVALTINETKKKEKLLQWDFWFTNRCNWHKYDNGMAYQETKM